MFNKVLAYQTRIGNRVELYNINGGGSMPIHGAILRPGNGWEVCCWNEEGFRVSRSIPHPDDVLGEWSDLPRRKIAYINPLGTLGLFDEGQVPQDVLSTGTRATWLDEPEAK